MLIHLKQVNLVAMCSKLWFAPSTSLAKPPRAVLSCPTTSRGCHLRRASRPLSEGENLYLKLEAAEHELTGGYKAEMRDGAVERLCF